MLELVGAVALVSGGYGFGRVAAFIARNLHDWWHPEAVAASAVSLCLFGATAAVLLP